MNGYFYTLLVTSVCGAVCALLASGGYEKYIKYIASLICVLVMISPFRNIDIKDITDNASGGFSLPETSQSQLYKTSAEMTEERAETYINEIVFNKFGIKPLSTDIKIDWGKEEPIIENISVFLSKGDFSKSNEIKAYLYEVLGGEVDVIEG